MDNQETAALCGRWRQRFRRSMQAIEHMEKQNAAADRQEQAEQTAKSEEGRARSRPIPKLMNPISPRWTTTPANPPQDDDNGDISLKGDATAILRDGRKGHRFRFEESVRRS